MIDRKRRNRLFVRFADRRVLFGGVGVEPDQVVAGRFVEELNELRLRGEADRRAH